MKQLLQKSIGIGEGDMGMLYEYDDIEVETLMGATVARARTALNDGQPLTEMSARPGERVQTFWCEGCKDWHTGSVLGGPIGDPHGEDGQ